MSSSYKLQNMLIVIKALITDLNKKIIQNVMYFSWYRKKNNASQVLQL